MKEDLTAVIKAALEAGIVHEMPADKHGLVCEVNCCVFELQKPFFLDWLSGQFSARILQDAYVAYSNCLLIGKKDIAHDLRQYSIFTICEPRSAK